MANAMHLNGRMFRIYLAIGLIMIAGGAAMLFASGSNPSPGPATLSMGTALAIIGFSGYIHARARAGRTLLPYYLLSAALLMSSAAAIMLTLTSGAAGNELGIPGLSAFIMGLCITATGLLLSGKVAAGISTVSGAVVMAAGVPLFIFYGLRPGFQEYMYVSVLPLLAGASLLASGKLLEGLDGMRRRLAAAADQ